MTAREIVELIKKNAGVPFNERTYRDTFKCGNPDTQVKGIATTMFSTLEMLQRANKMGLNFVIPHEDTYWNDRDDTKDALSLPLYKIKTDFVTKSDMVIWRDHDNMHAMKPDFTVVGELRDIGVKATDDVPMAARVRTVPETTLGEFASAIKKRTGWRAIRCVGDPKMKLTKVLNGPGYATPRFSQDTDIVVGGESQEADGGFDNVEYVADAATLGMAKGLVMLGHCVSEQSGMEDMAKWLQGFIKDIPIKYVPCEEPFWT